MAFANAGEFIKAVRDDILDPDSAPLVIPRYDDSILLREINQAREEVARLGALVERKQVFDVVTGQQEYPLPADFVNSQILTYVDSPGAVPTTLEEVPIREVANTPMRGRPSKWARWSGKIVLDVVPSKSVTGGLTIYYYGLPDPYTANNPVPAVDLEGRFHDAARLLASYRMLKIDEEDEKAQRYLLDFEREMSRIVLEQHPASLGDIFQVRDSYDMITGGFAV